MIRADMDWKRLSIFIRGHAGYSDIGSDIVCAGASMLTEALNGVLTEAEARGRTKIYRTEKEGGIIIRADPGLGSLNEIKAYYRMCAKGLKMLAEEYPKHVEIKEMS